MNISNSTNEPDFIATEVQVKAGQIRLTLLDGSTHSFPIHFYPRLCSAKSKDISAVKLRVGGRALRWESLDEDIWVADAIMRRYPSATVPQVA